MPKTKTELNTDIAARWPNNTSGSITAADLRFIGTGIISSIPNYSSGGYIMIDAVPNTGSLGLQGGMLVWDTGTQKIFFWAGTGYRQVAFV